MMLLIGERSNLNSFWFLISQQLKATLEQYFTFKHAACNKHWL